LGNIYGTKGLKTLLACPVSDVSKNLIREWTRKHRPQVEPEHQIERYAWMRDNVRGEVLSVGCGEAKVEEYIYLDDNCEVKDATVLRGVDFNPEFLVSARARWPRGIFRHCDIRNMRFPFEDDAVETVLMGDVLEHVPPFYFHHVLSEALRISKPGGRVLITFPNGDFLGNGNASSVYSSDHCWIVTKAALDCILNPLVAWKWWMETGNARHGFKYGYLAGISMSQRFIFVLIENGKED